MKKMMLLLLLDLVFSNNSIAQNFIAIPDSGAKWINHNFSYPPSTPQAYYFIFTTNGSDTTINNTNYFQLLRNVNGPYYGAMRNDSGKVFIIPKDSVNEYIAYDFTANVGDTIFNVYEDGGAFTFFGGIENIVIQYVSTVDLGDGILRRQLQTQNGKLWIEGIGSSYGLFAEDGMNVSNYGSDLSCFSIGNTSLYPTYANAVCEMGVGLSSIIENKILIAYPNPTSTIFTIEAESSISNIFVYDALGQMINLPKEINLNKVIFFTDKLENGFYFIAFEINNQKYFQQLMKQD